MVDPAGLMRQHRVEVAPPAVEGRRPSSEAPRKIGCRKRIARMMLTRNRQGRQGIGRMAERRQPVGVRLRPCGDAVHPVTETMQPADPGLLVLGHRGAAPADQQQQDREDDQPSLALVAPDRPQAEAEPGGARAAVRGLTQPDPCRSRSARPPAGRKRAGGFRCGSGSDAHRSRSASRACRRGPSRPVAPGVRSARRAPWRSVSICRRRSFSRSPAARAILTGSPPA